MKWASVLMLLLLTGCSADKNDADAQAVASAHYKTANTEQVVKALNDDDWVVVDTRLNDAFNGWALEGVSRGGHIDGAVDFSANWLKVKADDSAQVLAEALETKGISKNKQIILYDVNGRDAKEVAVYLQEKGFGHVYLYDVKRWADDPALPMTRYENYQMIVPAVVVKALIDGEKPETFEQAKSIKIVEASWGEEKTSYSNGHIPTAFHINTDDIEPPTKQPPLMWLLADSDALTDVAKKYGFTKDDTVVMTAEEPLSAYRVATVLRYMGVSDVRVLNGGHKAWTMAGYALETDSHKPVPNTDFGTKIPARPDVIDTMAAVKEGLTKPEQFTLVDNRTWDEYIGKISGYSYHDKTGRIPGAVFGYAGKKTSYSMEYYRNLDNTMRNADEIRDLWRGQGIDTNTHLSFMCGSGWRVAEIYSYADVMGIQSMGIYSDGWIGWSNTPGNPVVSGESE
ncbi:rhodanese-like domain-containing protein [Endozoicomonas sp.]|nr:rhodanese-like domain-containing protein [Endozoicomonas sp.]